MNRGVNVPKGIHIFNCECIGTNIEYEKNKYINNKCEPCNIYLELNLMHKKSKIEQNLAWMILLRNCYTHFALEHTKGHH